MKGTVASIDAEDRMFTMTPIQYIVLTLTSLPFSIRAHFAGEPIPRTGKKRIIVNIVESISMGEVDGLYIYLSASRDRKHGEDPLGGVSAYKKPT